MSGPLHFFTSYILYNVNLFVTPFFVFFGIFFWIKGKKYKEYGREGRVELGEGGEGCAAPSQPVYPLFLPEQPVYPLFLRSATMGVLQAPKALGQKIYLIPKSKRNFVRWIRFCWGDVCQLCSLLSQNSSRGQLTHMKKIFFICIIFSINKVLTRPKNKMIRKNKFFTFDILRCVRARWTLKICTSTSRIWKMRY